MYTLILVFAIKCELSIDFFSSGALYIEGSLKVLSKSFNIGMTYSGEAENNIDFTSNADFYEMPLKLCMQMKKPEMQFL